MGKGVRAYGKVEGKRGAMARMRGKNKKIFFKKKRHFKKDVVFILCICGIFSVRIKG